MSALDNLCQQSLLDLIKGEVDTGAGNDSVLELARLEFCCRECVSCSLRSGCRQVVFGEGNPCARLMLIGEGPGADEDRVGRPFVGSAGKLLDRILDAAGFKRDELYIANVVKCRPPGNRVPSTQEVERCLPHLIKQIELISPAIIVCLGALATRTLIDRDASITRSRGKWHGIEGRSYMPTFHPAALLRDPNKKRPVWEDFKQVRELYRRLTMEGAADE